ncbi:restriction endonuclease subunit S [Holdemanella biformis]|uniref:restriction endonuclease subunit S n=1 Tax=Holdemanella biformis TaxID=1735 RepID=UPI0022DEB80E|nr:restriction endonuclease subunit S [Holdemanella biformis]
MKVKVGEITKIKTGKLDANASSADGKYPFFTCSKDPLRINSYSYDCECVLVAGNGDLNVKYYNGKFDAYQRTYIIEDNSNGLLYMPYLYHFLEGYIGELRKQSIGGVIKYIKLGNLTDVLVELPSIEEQKYIVNLMNISLELIELRKKTIDKLDSLVKARFIEMFGDPQINEKGFTKAPMGEYLSLLTDFSSNGSYKALDSGVVMYDEPNYAWMVRTTDLESGDKSSIKYIDEKAYELLSKSKIFGGEIIMNKIGSAGKIYIIPKLTMPASLGRNAFMFRYDERINNIFIYYLLTSDYGQREIQQYVRGAVTKTITKDDARAVLIIVPPLELQLQFADFVHQVDKSRFDIKKSIIELEREVVYD